MLYHGNALPEDDLDFALAAVQRSFVHEHAGRRFAALCLMAVIVSRYPLGDLQDEAEDWLSACIGDFAPTSDELQMVRHFRAHGIDGEAGRALCPRQESHRDV
jgi:hypothetical protein